MQFGLHKRGSSAGIRLCCNAMGSAAAEVTTSPLDVVLDERGKATFSVTLTGTGDVRLVVDTMGDDVVPVASGIVGIHAAGSAASELVDTNARLFAFRDDVPPLVFIESVGTCIMLNTDWMLAAFITMSCFFPLPWPQPAVRI